MDFIARFTRVPLPEQTGKMGVIAKKEYSSSTSHSFIHIIE